MNIKDRIQSIQKQIQMEAHHCQRNFSDIQLVAVSKKHSADHVWSAIQAGASILGENYIQEARDKIKDIELMHQKNPHVPKPSWHFIGHLQRNKAKYAVRCFDLIHSVDSIELAEEIDRCAQKQNKHQNILIQVSTGETTKSGMMPHHLESMLQAAMSLSNIAICGLMIMPPYSDHPEDSRPHFKHLAGLLKQIKTHSGQQTQHPLNHLSMGMTGDYHVAIQEGATFIRVGTAIFGNRPIESISIKEKT
ncbi:MAG: YggS family pyridoxal phosphate-dependent enzyme [Candidatus Magnetomorum sp.]|nr:YggS family pyridoxal phosphate-dependent enzyme [Candidatus Magnetomorum sp.]